MQLQNRRLSAKLDQTARRLMLPAQIDRIEPVVLSVFPEASYHEACNRISVFSAGPSGIDLREHPQAMPSIGALHAD